MERRNPPHAPAALEPGVPRYLVAYHWGYMCGMAGQAEQALGLLRETVALKPDFSEAHCNLGIELAKTGRLAEAVAALHEAVALKRQRGQVLCREAGKLAAVASHAERDRHSDAARVEHAAS